MRSESAIRRRKTRQIMVGRVPVGGDAPISVQSMTNTEPTAEAMVESALTQIDILKSLGLWHKGVNLVDELEAMVRARVSARQVYKDIIASD